MGFPTAGELQELTAIAAVIIGGASFFGGRGTVINVIVGALIIGVIQNGLNLLNVNVYYQLVAACDRCNSGRARRAQAQARATLPYTPGQGGMRHGDRAGTAAGRRTEVPSSR